jgi:prepilin-type N-terminal cleavage/methylation domain-containing protein
MQGQRENGFSLIEVLIAMVILAVGLLALSSMQGTFASGSADSRQRMRAMDLAKSQLNVLKTLDYTAPRLTDDGAGGLADTGSDADFQNTASTPSQHIVYWNIAENTSANFKHVRVIVVWNNGEDSVSLDWIKPEDRDI